MLMFMLLQLNLTAMNITGDTTLTPYSNDIQRHKLLQQEFELTQKRKKIEVDLDHLGKQIDSLQRCRDEELQRLGETYKELKSVRQDLH
jgi:peptidoglycan hydrolase CwlO-like protein